MSAAVVTQRTTEQQATNMSEHKHTNGDMNDNGAHGDGSAAPLTAAASADDDDGRRVKVYQLNDVGQWDDKGTGYVSILNPHDLSLTIVVKAESAVVTSASVSSPPSSSITLLHHKLSDGMDYQRQGDTILTWCEQSTGLDLALSFQSAIGCSNVWTLITNIQGIHNENDMVITDRTTAGEEDTADTPPVSLPLPTANNIAELCTRIQTLTQTQREGLCAFLSRDDPMYITHLFTLQQSCEHAYEANLNAITDKNTAEHQTNNKTATHHRRSSSRHTNHDTTIKDKNNRQLNMIEEKHKLLLTLEHICLFMRHILLLNEAELILSLCADDKWMSVVACLEYDNAYSNQSEPTITVTTVVPSGPTTTSTVTTTSVTTLVNINSPTAHQQMTTTSTPPSTTKLHESTASTTSPTSSISSASSIHSSSSPVSPSITTTQSAWTIPSHNYHSHRQFLNASSLHSILPLPSTSTTTIQQTYRLTYLKDVLLLRILDDATLATLSSLVFMNVVGIITALNEKREYMETIIKRCKRYARITPLAVDEDYNVPHVVNDDDQDTTALPATAAVISARHQVYSFLHELLTLAKTVPMPTRDQFYRTLVDLGILRAIEQVMLGISLQQSTAISMFSKQTNGFTSGPSTNSHMHTPTQHRTITATRSSSSATTAVHESDMINIEEFMESEKDSKSTMWYWIICTDMLTNLLIHDAQLVRTYVQSESNIDNGLLYTLFHTLTRAPLFLGMGHQLSCILRLLLDPDLINTTNTPATDDSPTTEFLATVYQHYMPSLTDMLRDSVVMPVTGSISATLTAGNNNAANTSSTSAAHAKSLSSASDIQAHYHALELLSFCAVQHPTLFPSFAANTALFGILSLYIDRNELHPSQTCSIIRFARTAIATKQALYAELLLLAPTMPPQQQPDLSIAPDAPACLLTSLIRLFISNGARYNLLNSTLIDFLLYIINEGTLMLLNICVDYFGTYFDTMDYLSIGKEMRAKYEALKADKTMKASRQHSRSSEAAGSDTDSEDAEKELLTELVINGLDHDDEHNSDAEFENSNGLECADENSNTAKLAEMSTSDQVKPTENGIETVGRLSGTHGHSYALTHHFGLHRSDTDTDDHKSLTVTIADVSSPPPSQTKKRKSFNGDDSSYHHLPPRPSSPSPSSTLLEPQSLSPVSTTGRLSPSRLTLIISKSPPSVKSPPVSTMQPSSPPLSPQPTHLQFPISLRPTPTSPPLSPLSPPLPPHRGSSPPPSLALSSPTASTNSPSSNHHRPHRLAPESPDEAKRRRTM